jgi:prepilin signal peptidase PulO-like enzyme (type II secretory pathway)
MMLPLFSGAFGAVLFGMAGRLGRHLSDSWYGTIEREADGPLSLALPVWPFIAAPACIGIIVGIRGAEPLHWAILAIAVLSLTVCAATDVRTGMIPDLFTLGALFVVLAFSTARREWAPLLGALFAFVPFAAIAAVSRGRGMGWGDVKLAALGGALVGMGGITLAVAIASMWACIVSVVTRRARQPIAFGPYLAVSIGAALGLGNSF